MSNRQRSVKSAGLFSEIIDDSESILPTHGTARVLLAGDAEANEEYVANGPYTGL